MCAGKTFLILIHLFK